MALALTTWKAGMVGNRRYHPGYYVVAENMLIKRKDVET